MEENTRQLLYVSNTRRDLPDPILADILAAARKNNAPCGVTGMLLHLDGAFLQVLEGEAAAVEDIFQRIKKDSRHWNTQVLLDRTAPRAFAQWSMGFEKLPTPSEHAFQVEADALSERIDPDALKDLPALIKTFYRIQKQ